MYPSGSRENVPRDASPINFDMADFLANMTAEDMALLVGALGAQTKPTPKGDDSVEDDQEDTYDLYMFNGLNLTRGSRTAAQVVNNKVRVSHNDRGKDPDQKVKTFTHWCGYSLTHKLKQPDITKLFSSSTDDDIGTAAISSQTAFDGIVDWFRQVDAHYLLQMPDCENLFDYKLLKFCSTSKDLTNIKVCRDTELSRCANTWTWLTRMVCLWMLEPLGRFKSSWKSLRRLSSSNKSSIPSSNFLSNVVVESPFGNSSLMLLNFVAMNMFKSYRTSLPTLTFVISMVKTSLSELLVSKLLCPDFDRMFPTTPSIVTSLA
jgi:hypothetical protein